MSDMDSTSILSVSPIEGEEVPALTEEQIKHVYCHPLLMKLREKSK